MKQEQLKRGTELVCLIKSTSKALENMRMLQDQHKPLVAGAGYQGCIGFVYNLCISEYSDGSGISAELNRYEGNQQVVEAIVRELERQLAIFQQEFDSL